MKVFLKERLVSSLIACSFILAVSTLHAAQAPAPVSESLKQLQPQAPTAKSREIGNVNFTGTQWARSREITKVDFVGTPLMKRLDQFKLK